MPTTEQKISELYIGYYDRAPDPEGLAYWVARVNAGVSLADIANSFATSPEAMATYAFFGFPTLASATDFLNSVYENLFGRAADADGLAYYSAKLSSGATPVGEIIAEILGNAETNDGSADQLYLANKVTVGLDWALTAANTLGYTYNDAAASSAHSVIDGVDATPQSVTTAEAATDSFFAGVGNVGTTYVLTTDIESLVGDSGNNLIIGVFNDATNGSTLQSGDRIDGGAGDDTLEITSSNSNFNRVYANLIGVETIDVRAFASAQMDLSTSTGIETIEQTAGTRYTNFYNLQNMVDIALTDTHGGGLAVYYADATTDGAADVQNVLLTDGGGSVYASYVETFDVTSAGSRESGNWVALTSDATLRTINVTGAANIDVEDVPIVVTSLDASTATGDVTANFTPLHDIAIKGGSGDDNFEIFRLLTAGDAIDGGAGTDTLNIFGGQDFTSAAAAAPLNALTSIEHLEFYENVGNTTTINGASFTNAAVTDILFDTTGADAVLNADSAHTYAFGIDSSLAYSEQFGMSGSNTTLNVELRGEDGSPNFANDGQVVYIGALDVTLSGTAPAGSVSTINLASTGDVGAGNFNFINGIDAVGGSKIIITGDSDTDISSLYHSATVDASALQGELTIAGSAFTAYTGPGTYVSGQDTITLAKEASTVNFGTHASGVVSDAAGTLAVDTIIGFTGGADGDVAHSYIGSNTYTAATPAIQDGLNALPTADTLADAANYVAANDTAVGWTAFSFQGTTYAFHDFSLASTSYDQDNDVLVALTGATPASLTQDNFA